MTSCRLSKRNTILGRRSIHTGRTLKTLFDGIVKGPSGDTREKEKAMPKTEVTPDVRIGDKFGFLTIREEPEFIKTGQSRKRRWRCLVSCKCGKTYYMLVQNLLKTHSCRCGNTAQIKHGMSCTSIYKRWRGMIQRCSNKNHRHWSRYGGRGIAVCAEWTNFESFLTWATQNRLRKGMSIDRIDNNGNYCPENCRVVTHMVNQHNKSTSRMGTIDGETKCIAAWAKDPRCSVSYQTVLSRLRYGWNISDAVMKPVSWIRTGNRQ